MTEFTAKELEEIALISEAGEDIESLNQFGYAPLHDAVCHNKESTVLLLLEKGANVNVKCKYGNTPLQYAARGGQLKIILLLLEHKADVNTKNNYNATPLDHALWRGVGLGLGLWFGMENIPETIALLKQHGAE